MCMWRLALATAPTPGRMAVSPRSGGGLGRLPLSQAHRVHFAVQRWQVRADWIGLNPVPYLSDIVPTLARVWSVTTLAALMPKA